MIAFRDTKLYGMLKRAYALQEIRNAAHDYIMEERRNPATGRVMHGHYVHPITHDLVGLGTDAINGATAGVRLGLGGVNMAANGVIRLKNTIQDPIADAGTRFGGTLGDLFGKLNPDAHNYPDEDIVKLINDKEEIALMNRETERLKRLARIQYRKQKKLEGLTEKAVKSPFI